MRASEFITEAPRVAAIAPEIVSVQDDGKTITIKVRTHDGSVRSMANSNPAVIQQWLNVKYGLRLPHSIAKKFAGMPAAMTEEQLDEKSTSQAQFRTMAAAAHNPKFARKVGISQSVAQEFHGADRGANYKKLPKKATEGEIDEVLGFTITRDKQPKKPAASLATMRKEFEKDKSGSVEKTAQGRGNPVVVKYVRKTTDEDASWGMAPESQGHEK
jgi:hypothetical protein